MNKSYSKVLLSGLLATMLVTGCSHKESEVKIEDIVINSEEIRGQESVVLTPLDNVYFYFDSYELDNKANRVIHQNIYNIKHSDREEVVLRGHTDEWGSDEYNYALGLKRAEIVKTELENNGIDNVRVISLGESEPVCEDKTIQCWSENRRVEFK